MSLHIVFSNRLDILGKHLLAALDGIPADPLAPHHVVVPSTAIARRLQLAIAGDKGICANVRFNFLGNWLWQLARSVDAAVPERSPLAPEVLSWLALRLLREGRFRAFPRLEGFLADADELMLLDLAQGVAQVFDHYATYRPDWLMTWSSGGTIPDFRDQPGPEADEAWQRELWRSITREIGLDDMHPLQRFIAKIGKPGRPESGAGLPASAAIFAVPGIPPLYLQTLCRLSAGMDITLYLLNPCREYWFEIVPPRRLAYLERKKRAAHREVGHALLADWGRATQAAVDLVYTEAVTDRTSDAGEFYVPEGETLLRRLQRSLLDMEDLEPGSLLPADDDRSIEIHCCHGAIRELEVLQDRLLSLFAQDATLQSDDVAVLTPDIDALAPAVDAVFGAAPATHFLPYAIAGRAPARTNPYLRILLDVLDLTSSRLPASRVFDLLRQEPVARRFALDAAGLKRVRRWLPQAGMHWGSDGDHRRETGVPAEERHTFRGGLDALFLGLALPDLDAPLAGLLPADNVEGSRADTLGGLWLFIRRLSDWRRRLRHSPPAGEWQGLLNEMLADFTAADDNGHGAYDRIAGAVAELAASWRAAGLTQGISARVVRAALLAADVARRGATPAGTITFASLAAMRGLGYRVICLIGMDDNAFPVRERPREFDLIPKGRPRRGDRQRRREDRGTFLDVLLAAGDILHISYAGRDRRNNDELPPSVLVAQLRDYLARAIAPPQPTEAERGNARRRLTVEHPLQPFSRRYFDGADPRLYSYAATYAAALTNHDHVRSVAAAPASQSDEPGEADGGPPELPPVFFNGMPPAPARPDTEIPVVTGADLAAFLANPSRFFLQRRLHIQLLRPEDILSDEEPLTMDFSAERKLADIIVSACEAQGRMPGWDEALAIIRARPASPAGSAGAAGLSLIWPAVASLAGRVLAATGSPRRPARQEIIPLDVRGQRWHLTAVLNDLRPAGLVRYRCDDLRGYDQLLAWLPHLVLCVVRPAGIAPETRHMAFNADLVFGAIPPEQARGYLADLVGLYAAGLSRPVPFFRKAAWAYAENDGPQKKTAAGNKWRGYYGEQSPPEGADIWHALAWRGVPDPLDEEFAASAALVFDPIRLHRTVTELDIAGG